MSERPYYVQVTAGKYDVLCTNQDGPDALVFVGHSKAVAKDLAFILNEARETRRAQAEAQEKP